ncbi:MAG: hypothetical protein ACRDTV_19970 [Mycobacterium sp.]
MEGDAGTSRLTPADTEDVSSEVTTDQAGTDVTAEDLVTTDAEAQVDEVTTNAEDVSQGEDPVIEGNPSRLGRGWLIGIAATLLVLAGGVGVGGYFALRFNQHNQAIARNDVEAVARARDCVAATQAPDIAAMAISAQKIIDCSTGGFRAQAVLYSSLFVEAYQVANAQVGVSALDAAAERSHADGSVDVLVALRVKVSNAEAQNREVDYRLRVTMALDDDGQYRMAKIDQVAT